MSTLEASTWALAHRGSDVVETTVADDHSLASSAEKRGADRRGWQKLIDSELVEWGRDPAQLDDEGVETPSRETIDRACRLAITLREAGWSAPQRIVASADGGIVFERWSQTGLSQIDVRDCGGVAFTVFQQGRMIAHVVLAE